ncbi:uncharacterized protein LOC131213282, partial [Anopheles bellator]|uniref:uncharacterized protein LOC131213282 n=1 Tax=Anopheles bellator TaxID=139047 RepID=UPI002648EB0F
MEQKKHLEMQATGENVLLDDEPGFNLFENLLPNFPMEEESTEELPLPEPPRDELSVPPETGSVCDVNIDQRLQIRHDCMWSGVCVDLSHPEKFGLGLGEGCCIDGGGDPLVLLAQEQQRNQLQNLAPEVAKPGNTTSAKESAETLKPQSTPFRVPTTVAEIPAGSSLLIKRSPQQQQPQNRAIVSGGGVGVGGGGNGSGSSGNYSTNVSPSTSTLRLPYIPTGAFMKNREHHILSGAIHHHTSSNTPLSVDDDPPEFKHKLDLVATCTVSCSEAPAATGSAAPSASSAVSSGSINGENVALNYCNQTAQLLQDDATAQLSAGYMRSTSIEPLGGQLWTVPDSSDSGFSSNSLSQLLRDLREIEERDSATLSSAFSFSSQTIDNSVRSSGECGDRGSCSNFHYWNWNNSSNSSNSSSRRMTKSSCASLAGDLTDTTVVSAAIKKVTLTTVHRKEKTLVENDDAEEDDKQDDELLFDTAPSDSPVTAKSFSFEKHDDEEEEDFVEKGCDLEQDDELPSDASASDSPRGLDSSFTSCSEEDDDDDDDEEHVEKKGDRPQQHNKRFSDAAAAGESAIYAHCSSTSCSEEDDNDDGDEEDYKKGAPGYGSSNGYGPSRATRRHLGKRGVWCQRRQNLTGRLGDGGQPAKRRKLNKNDSSTNFDSATATSPTSFRDTSVGRRRGGSATSSDSLPFEGRQATHVGDHSYTRPKGHFNMNDLGVQTPSESEEEIDVVSIGDKNLPTNPTARDRRALQSTVASKIRKQQAAASSRHAASGSAQYGGSCLHRQQQHRVDDDRYVSGSHSLNVSGGGGVNLMLGIYPTPAGSTTISGANTPLLTGSGCSSVASSPPPVPSSARKRSGISSSSSARGSNSKHHRGGSSSVKRSRRQGKKSASSTGASRAADPHCDVTAHEPDSAEKRNLHNNMERQRRIGLKNRFEELKRQIPSLRDKD